MLWASWAAAFTASKAQAEATHSWNGRHYAQCGLEVTRRSLVRFP